MAKFKVGDKVTVDGGTTVRVVAGSRNKFGDTKESYKFLDHYLLGDDGYFFDPNKAALVESPAAPSELEQLVATANAGLAALHELKEKKYEDQLEVCTWANSTDGKTAPTEGFVSVRALGDGHYPSARGYFRVKQKRAFEPFTIGQGWKVEMRGTDRVAVGCQEFDTKALETVVSHLTSGNNAGSVRGNGAHTQLVAVRNGISSPWGVLPWADADRLLEALRGVR